MDKAKREAYEKSFATHKAELIQNTERFLIIDWRKEDGSGDYYVNYIVDKKRGSLIVSGDLGDSIATWYNPLDPANLKQYIQNVDYYVGKFQAASDRYFYETENIIADMKKEIEVVSSVVDGVIYSIDELWELIEEEVANCEHGRDFIPSDTLNHILEEIGYDYNDTFEWLYRCGERICHRVYLWAVGFDMACEQLGI